MSIYAETIDVPVIGQVTVVYSITLNGKEELSLLLPSYEIKGIKIVDYEKQRAKIVLQRDDNPNSPLLLLDVDYSNIERFNVRIKRVEHAEDLFNIASSIAVEEVSSVPTAQGREEEKESETKGEGEG
jgi:hypothetical protein